MTIPGDPEVSTLFAGEDFLRRRSQYFGLSSDFGLVVVPVIENDLICL